MDTHSFEWLLRSEFLLRLVRITKGIFVPCSFAFSVGMLFTPSALAQNAVEAQRDYNYGLAAYQKANYAQAVEYFKSAIKKDPACSSHCLRKLYLAHSYAGMKELGMAIKVYHEIEDNCFGSAEARLATECIEKLKQPITARTIVSNQKSSGDSLINRIKVLEVRHSDVAIDPAFIGLVKSTVSHFRSDMYQMLDKGGCTVTIAQNIIDKWPNARNLSRPGYERLKLSQDYGLTQGVDIYIWERPIFPGHILGEPFDRENIRFYLQMQLGRVACHTQGIDEDKDYLTEYNKDMGKLTKEDKLIRDVKYITEADGPGQMAGFIIANYLTYIDEDMKKLFPNSYAWIKKRMKL